MKKIYFTVLLLLLNTSYSQTHFGIFPTIDHSGKLSEKWNYSLYYFGAFNLLNSKVNGIAEDPNFFAFYSEQALTYSPTNHLSFTGSYVYERQYPFGDNYRNENRFYLQTAYKYDLNRTSIKHRLRFDGRFIEDKFSGKSPFTSRLRYSIGLKTPLKKDSDKLYLNMYNEFFFNLNKSAASIYGENWAYAGVGFKLNEKNSIETGPLYIFWVTNNQNDLRNFCYLQLTWVNQLDFTKKEKLKQSFF